MGAVHRFASGDSVPPRAQPSGIAQRRKFPGNYPQRFLKNVFRNIGVANDGPNMFVERTLQRAQKTVERSSVAGLCPPDEQQLVSALRQRALIDSRAISTRPTEREM